MQEYYLGLDIGTDSVGWAVTDLQYKILKKNGKALWGTRLFPEANTAADRRANRIARRRIERREQRIALLRDIFAPAVAAVDPAFFQRLDESKFLEADKRPDGSGAPLGKYALFADGAYCDRDYHPGIPHHLPPAAGAAPGGSRIRRAPGVPRRAPHSQKARAFPVWRFGARGRDL